MALAFSRLLLAYDDFTGSHVALEYACAIARTGATLTVAHAVDEIRIVASAMTADGFATATDPSTLIDAVDERGADTLKRAVAACAALGVTAQSALIHDDARSGIAELERNAGSDLVVVGTHARHGLQRALLGSVAERIVGAGTVPALVVAGHANLPRTGIGTGTPFSRVLVALDDSIPARAALAVAARLTHDAPTRLLLCTVTDSRDLRAKAGSYGYDIEPFEADLHARSTKLLEAAKSASGVSGSIDELIAVEGEPADRIEHTAMQHNCDLIVVGSHLRAGLERLAFGSVAEAVIGKSVLPVLVVPASKAAA